MCGINFFWDKKNQYEGLKIIQKMNKSIAHRGKENEGFFGYHNFYLGHLRLKIVDLSEEANQPFISDDKRYALIFNGEIYNFETLKKQFLSKYTFKTSSDTEFLLYYLIDNQDIELLNGIFAFVFIDFQTQKIIFQRDAQGVKPLYYFENENFLLISSEIKGIIASNLITKKLNHSQIFPYLVNRFAHFPYTFFEGIFEVAPLLIAKKNISFEKFNPKNLLLDLDITLKKSIQAQCLGDVPIGVFLSGGVDSTLILAYLQEIQYLRPTAFTITHTRKEMRFSSNDTKFAEQAAQQFGANWINIEVNENILTKMPDFLRQIDTPIADSAYFLTYLLAEKTTQTHKVVFSGAGADELFGGYHRHWAFYKYLKINQLLGKKWIKWTKLLQSFPLKRHWKKLIENIETDEIDTFIHFTQNYWKNFYPQKQTILPQNNVLEWALDYDKTHFLQQDVLKINDLAAMQHTLEVRVPFLDKQVIDFVNQIPTDFLFKNGQKWLLKYLLKQKGGQKFGQRKKEGFGMAFGKWIREEKHKQMIENQLHQKHFIFQYVHYDYFKKLWYLHQTQKRDYTQEIFAIWNLSIWLDLHF